MDYRQMPGDPAQAEDFDWSRIFGDKTAPGMQAPGKPRPGHKLLFSWKPWRVLF